MSEGSCPKATSDALFRVLRAQKANKVKQRILHGRALHLGFTCSWSPSSNNTKDKYTSAAAEKYKEELARRASADLHEFGQRNIFIEGMQTAVAPATPSSQPENFFDTWDKAKAPPPPVETSNLISLTPNSSRPATPRAPSPALSARSTQSASAAKPSNGATASPITADPTPTTTAPLPMPAAAPRTISSSALRTGTAGAAPARSRLGASRTTGAATGTAGKSKLGAKKAGTTINFEEAEKKAREEEERLKKLGYDSIKEAEEAEAAAKKQREQQAAAAAQRSTNSTANNSNKTHVRRESDNERLGMGMKRLGFGQVSGVSGADSAKAAEAERKAAERRARGYDDEVQETPTYARDKFSAQKGISSDQYFGRNAYDPEASRTAQTRLQQFSGATAISSNQYFGIDEDEASRVEENILGIDSLQGLENSAKQLARSAMQSAGFDDVSQLQDALRTGAMRLGDIIQRYA